MRINRKLVIVICLFLFISLWAGTTVSYAEQKTVPRDWDRLTSSNGSLRASAVKSEAAILMDAHTGQVLFEKHADAKMYPASITKIMTCVVVLENAKLSDLVTIGHIGSMEKGAKKVGLAKDEILSVEYLLYGLMLHSGNDAGVALAVHVAGSVEAFADLMNEKAKEIGMTGSHFVNPHGLHDSNHYTTARDMATLVRYAQRTHPDFVKIVSTYKYTWFETNKCDKKRTWLNSNRLIKPQDTFYFEYATGVKTGYTGAALHTLVTSAEKGDQSLISVVLRHKEANTKWNDSTTMFLYGFEFYDTIKLSNLLANNEVIVDVSNAATTTTFDKLKLLMRPQVQTYLTDKKSVIEDLRQNPERFQQQIQVPENLSAPITKDQLIGTVDFLHNDEVVLTCDLIAAHAVEPVPIATAEPTPEPQSTPVPGTVDKPDSGIPDLWLYVGGGAVALIILIIALLSARRTTRYRQYNQSNPSTRRREPKHSRRRY